MFDRVSEAAEKLATNISRRAFMGRLGKGALGLAAVLGGIVALPGQAEAGSNKCCICTSSPGGSTCFKTSKPCRGSGGCAEVKCSDYPNLCPQ
jgi:hypothetical protein